MIPVFDFGGVIVDLRKTATIEAFDRLGFDIRPFLGTYKQGGIFAQLENGDITTAGFYNEIRRISANPTLTDEYIRLAWEAYLVGVPAERLACLRRVKQNYRTAVLSNTNPIHWAQAERDYFGTDGYTVADYFDTLFLSCDLHVQKPDPAIFDRVTAELGCAPEEILFFDDSEENCRVAAAKGWQVRLTPAGGAWVTEAFDAEGHVRHE